jgi:hypothetical protein
MQYHAIDEKHNDEARKETVRFHKATYWLRSLRRLQEDQYHLEEYRLTIHEWVTLFQTGQHPRQRRRVPTKVRQLAHLAWMHLMQNELRFPPTYGFAHPISVYIGATLPNAESTLYILVQLLSCHVSRWAQLSLLFATLSVAYLNATWADAIRWCSIGIGFITLVSYIIHCTIAVFQQVRRAFQSDYLLDYNYVYQLQTNLDVYDRILYSQKELTCNERQYLIKGAIQRSKYYH